MSSGWGRVGLGFMAFVWSVRAFCLYPLCFELAICCREALSLTSATK